MSVELKPCPFCGTSAHFFKVDDPDSRDFGGEGICCQTTGCASIGLSWSLMDDCKPSLAEKWNDRAELASAQARVVELEQALRGMVYGVGRVTPMPESLEDAMDALTQQQPKG